MPPDHAESGASSRSSELELTLHRRVLASPHLAAAVLRTAPRDCVIVLAFHRVGADLPPWHPRMTPAAFEQVVTTFARVTTPIRARDLRPEPRRGRRLVITLDDGFDDGAEVAAPILSRLGLPAAFFLPTDCITTAVPPWPDLAYARLLRLDGGRLSRLAARLAPGRPLHTRLEAAHAAVHGLKALDPGSRDRILRALPHEPAGDGRPMSWDQARGLRDGGFDIGSHGRSHAILTSLDATALAAELGGSKQELESRLRATCDLLAYPDNRHDETVRAAADAAGYRLAFGGAPAINAGRIAMLGVGRASGEDAPGLVALRLRLRPRGEASYRDRVGHYADGRAAEYGFVTQARLVRQALDRSRPASVLDAGAGAGALTPTLQATGAAEIVGVDAEPAMVAAARRLWPCHRWVRGDIARLPFAAGRFDAAVSLGVLEHVTDPAGAMRELARVVRPGGTVLASVPQRRSPNDLGFRLAGLLGLARRERLRPLTVAELRAAAAAAGLHRVTLRGTNFFAFPLDWRFPRASRRLAEAVDPAGALPGLRRLGAQLVLEGRVAPSREVTWLLPAAAAGSTFVERELSALRAVGVTVTPVVPEIGIGALRTLARHPVGSVRASARLQLLKAASDRERGRAGHVALALKGMTLADRLDRAPGQVHATFADGVGTIAFVAAELARCPFTFTAHAPYSLWQGSRLLKRQAEEARRVFCVSDDIEARLARLAPGSRRTVARCLGPTGSAGAIPERREARAGRFVAAGWLIPHKGFATAIDAVGEALAQGVELELEIAGEGPELEALREQARRLRVSDRVTFVGWLPIADVLERMATAVAHIAPCEVQPDGDRDGLPIAILDAAACAVPSIATAVSGIPEFVVDGETGLIVRERDPAALAAAMIRLAAEPETAARLGSAARERLLARHDPIREIAKLADAWFPDRADSAQSAPAVTDEAGTGPGGAGARRTT